ncbi:MAG: homoserine kinase [Halobacteriovorax sp.]|nr:homoserine kinase [Halobacteriovorax sp.]|tara:strand:+ start:61776 stop:62693 length:918 start_codon:yes stop_codon:yes gene_type:complete
MTKKITAFAPATCGNVCVGYDILGLCYSGVGDKVTVQKTAKPEVIIESITGEDSLSLDPTKNTAGVVLLEFIKKESLSFGFSIEIEKGISLGSGMGGSAASAVAALVAANTFLETPISKNKLLEYSLKGEELACGHGHADNTAPCLYGGLVLLSNGEVVELPFPEFIQILLIHPHLTVNTKDARSVLKPEFKLEEYVKQSQNLAGFIAGLYKNDPSLIKNSFEDVLVEPLRAKLTTGFTECQGLAKAEGALGYALSGSGPSQIALCESREQAENLRDKITSFYDSKGIETDSYIGSVNNEGAKVL